MTTRFGRALGGVLLITGTALGGGVLALPLINASYGWPYSTLYLTLIWLGMTYCAHLLVEVHAALPLGSHFMTMAQRCLGPWAEWTTLVVYLVMLYALVASYSAGGAEIVSGSLQALGCSLGVLPSTLGFVLCFGAIVFCGFRWLDYANRLLMLAKAMTLLWLVLILGPEVDVTRWTSGDKAWQGAAMLIMITSFGYAIVIPSLRMYLQDDIPLLRRVVLWGSILPWCIYLIWHAVLYGVLDHTDLMPLAQAPRPNWALSQWLYQRTGDITLLWAFRMFASLCLLTSFMGVVLSLSSFLADTCRFNGTHTWHHWALFGLTLCPPLLLVLYVPSAFITALGYAGYACWLLHVTLPLGLTYGARRCGLLPVTKPWVTHAYGCAAIGSLWMLCYF